MSYIKCESLRKSALFCTLHSAAELQGGIVILECTLDYSLVFYPFNKCISDFEPFTQFLNEHYNSDCADDAKQGVIG